MLYSAKKVDASEYFHSSTRTGCVRKSGLSRHSMEWRISSAPFSSSPVNRKYLHTLRTSEDYA